MKKEFLINAAGGNATAIMVLDSKQDRSWYAKHGDTLLKKYEHLGAEQSGFLIPSASHFEMAGGEFCGNATRSAAVAMFVLTASPDLSYTVSGFDGQVNSKVEQINTTTYDVTSIFPGMYSQLSTENVMLDDGSSAHVVDLGGIVHVLIQNDLPTNYERQHASIRKQFTLDDRPAVGVVWYQSDGNDVRIDPVVWVKEIDSFFYETSCGSGSIAAGVVTRSSKIEQVSGAFIEVKIIGDDILLRSEMEVLNHERNDDPTL